MGASSSSPLPPSASLINGMDLGNVALLSLVVGAAASSALSAASSAVAAPPWGDRLRPVQSLHRRGTRSSCPHRRWCLQRSTPAVARGRMSLRCRRLAGSCATCPSRQRYTAGIPRPDPHCAGGCAHFCNWRSAAGWTIRRHFSRQAQGPWPSPGRRRRRQRQHQQASVSGWQRFPVTTMTLISRPSPPSPTGRSSGTTAPRGYCGGSLQQLCPRQVLTAGSIPTPLAWRAWSCSSCAWIPRTRGRRCAL